MEVLVLILLGLAGPSLTCNSLAPAPILPIYNQSCHWSNTPEVTVISSIDIDIELARSVSRP